MRRFFFKRKERDNQKGRAIEAFFLEKEARCNKSRDREGGMTIK